MRRFLAADLTRRETEELASQFGDAGADGQAHLAQRSQARAARHVDCHHPRDGAAHAGYQALGRDIAWAVLDSGINNAHPHFARHKNIVAEVDCTKRAVTEGSAPDDNGHGTHVAGIIAGVHEFAGPPPRVFSGVAPQASLHIYKVLDGDGNGEDAWIIKALDHIASINDKAGKLVIHGVNMSLGGPFDQSTYGCGHTPLCEELRRLWRQGVRRRARGRQRRFCRAAHARRGHRRQHGPVDRRSREPGGCDSGRARSTNRILIPTASRISLRADQPPTDGKSRTSSRPASGSSPAATGSQPGQPRRTISTWR